MNPDPPHEEGALVGRDLGDIRHGDRPILRPGFEVHARARHDLEPELLADGTGEALCCGFGLTEPVAGSREPCFPQQAQEPRQAEGRADVAAGPKVCEVEDRQVGFASQRGAIRQRDAAAIGLANREGTFEDGEDPARGAHLGEHIGPAAGEPEPNEVGGRNGAQGVPGAPRSEPKANEEREVSARREAPRSEAKPNGDMRVGLRIAPALHELPQPLARLPELAARAEAAGFELLVVPERLSAQGGFPAALPVCAAAAAATQRLRIATGLLALPLHHPLRIAEDAATLDALSGGRFELGVGLGAELEAFGGFGLDRRERAARFEEALTVVRRAWADGPVSFSGQHFRCGEIEVFPKPVQAAGPPLWLGARGPDALVRAAQLGCGAVLEPETDPDRKSTRLNSSHVTTSRMPSSA